MGAGIDPQQEENFPFFRTYLAMPAEILFIALFAMMSFLSFEISIILGWIIYPVILVFIGSRFRALQNIFHEAIHGSLLPHPSENKLMTTMLGVFLWIDTDAYRKDHLRHHAYVGQREDSDIYLKTQHGLLKERDSFFEIFRDLFSKAYVEQYVSPLIDRNGLLPRLGMSLLIALLFGLDALLLFYLAPLFISYPVFQYLSDYFDHAGLQNLPELRSRTRNHFFRNSFLNWLIFPRNDGYHLLHHLYPDVRTKDYPEAHLLLTGNKFYLEQTVEISLSGKMIPQTKSRREISSESALHSAKARS